MNKELPLGEADARTRVVRFGPFELDVRAGELRKRGRTILLQEQPFQVLLMLLERPGDVVLREEIRKRLWPNDTFVQFAPSINAAIQRLREALGDSADQPRYVETVARRGYRLLEAVKTTGNGMGERGGCWSRRVLDHRRRLREPDEETHSTRSLSSLLPMRAAIQMATILAKGLPRTSSIVSQKSPNCE